MEVPRWRQPQRRGSPELVGARRVSVSSVRNLAAFTKRDHQVQFFSDPGVPGVRSMGPDLWNWVRKRGFWNLIELTLADEDTNSILTDNANRAIQGSVKMYVMQPCGN